jgi:hypothetical protein
VALRAVVPDNQYTQGAREMRSRIKALGVAILAIAAMSMVVVSAAHAATSELHVTGTGGEAANVTGEQVTQHNFKLTTSGLETKCTQAIFEGTIGAQAGSQQTTASEVQITGTYTGCQSQGPFGAAATVKMNGCKYTITDSATSLTGTVDINGCTTGKSIEVTTEGCTITVPEQTNATGHLVFSNTDKVNKEEQDVDVEITVESITYQTHGAFCILGNQEHQDGDYTGTATFRAYKDAGSAQKTHNGHTYQQLICGAQKGLFAT